MALDFYSKCLPVILNVSHEIHLINCHNLLKHMRQLLYVYIKMKVSLLIEFRVTNLADFAKIAEIVMKLLLKLINQYNILYFVSLILL